MSDFGKRLQIVLHPLLFTTKTKIQTNKQVDIALLHEKNQNSKSTFPLPTVSDFILVVLVCCDLTDAS